MIFIVLFFTTHLLLERGHTVLLKNGANVNAKMNDDHTPLSVAQFKGHARMIELLVANGAK